MQEPQQGSTAGSSKGSAAVAGISGQQGCMMQAAGTLHLRMCSSRVARQAAALGVQQLPEYLAGRDGWCKQLGVAMTCPLLC